MTDKPHGEWPPEGIPITQSEDVPKPQLTKTLSFTPDWYEASPLVKEWVDELCELADIPTIEVEQIVITFTLADEPPLYRIDPKAIVAGSDVAGALVRVNRAEDEWGAP